MQTASDIIDKFGGPAKLSKESGFPLTTIIGWRDANFIPEWRQPALIALGKSRKSKIVLKASDFPPVEARVPRRAAAA
jgi:hypothetical protein